jgi:Complex 1 protein (LYR family)
MPLHQKYDIPSNIGRTSPALCLAFVPCGRTPHFTVSRRTESQHFGRCTEASCVPPRARSYVATQFSTSRLPFPSPRTQVRSHVRALFRERRHLTSPALTKIQLEKGQRVRKNTTSSYGSVAYSSVPLASGLTRSGRPNAEMNVYGLYCSVSDA